MLDALRLERQEGIRNTLAFNTTEGVYFWLVAERLSQTGTAVRLLLRFRGISGVKCTKQYTRAYTKDSAQVCKFFVCLA